jgi:hypothetical protein
MTGLSALLSDGVLAVDVATAVTADLRAALPGLDEEELELEALLDAAGLSFSVLGQDPSAPRRRVVVAADVPEGTVTPQPDLGAALVRLAGTVPLRAVASVHVDEPGAQSRVAAGDLDDVDLLWYAPSEIAELLRA